MKKSEEYKYISLGGLSDGRTLSYAGANGIVKSEIKGIKRLTELAESGFSLESGFVSDKVIGKAAAFLMVVLGAKEVFGETVSRHALTVFERFGVNITYKFLVPAIINRSGDGICPMEKAVLNVENPTEAAEILRKKVKEMRKA